MNLTASLVFPAVNTGQPDRGSLAPTPVWLSDYAIHRPDESRSLIEILTTAINRHGFLAPASWIGAVAIVASIWSIGIAFLCLGIAVAFVIADQGQGYLARRRIARAEREARFQAAELEDLITSLREASEQMRRSEARARKRARRRELYRAKKQKLQTVREAA